LQGKYQQVKKRLKLKNISNNKVCYFLSCLSIFQTTKAKRLGKTEEREEEEDEER
jgi:hypothetical protein